MWPQGREFARNPSSGKNWACLSSLLFPGWFPSHFIRNSVQTEPIPKTQSLVWASLLFINEACFLLLTLRLARPAELSRMPNASPVSCRLDTPCWYEFFLQIIPASMVLNVGRGLMHSFPSCFQNRSTSAILPAPCLVPIFRCRGHGLFTGIDPTLLSHALAKSIFPSLRVDLGTIPSIAAPATFGCPDTAIKTQKLYHHQISPANVWRMGCALAAWLDSQIQKSQTTDMREPICFMSSRENKVEIAIKRFKRKKNKAKCIGRKLHDLILPFFILLRNASIDGMIILFVIFFCCLLFSPNLTFQSSW